MKNVTKLIVALLCLQLTFDSLRPAMAAEKAATRPDIAYRVALFSLRDMVAKNPNAFLDPTETRSDLALVDKLTMLQANQALLAKLKDSAYTMEEVRKDLIARLNAEEIAQRLEIRNLLLKMDENQIEKLAADSFAKGRYASELKMKYDTAYLLNEKRDVAYALLVSDLGNAKSDALKRLGLMNRESLKKELEGTTALLNMKGDGWKIALIVILAVAAAGLVSFGVVAATKKRHERKMKELEEDYANMTEAEIAAHEQAIRDIEALHQQNVATTNQHWQQETAALQALYDIREALREGQYTWQVCSVQNTPKTVSCPYDHRTYVGTEQCTKYCLKNPMGQEYGVNQLICSSAQIPWECFRPNAHDTGYSAGGTAGYNDGYNYGYQQTYTSAYNQAYQSAYSIAYNQGYPTGYQKGYDEGYADGLSAGRFDGYNDGYDDGYDVGYAAGYAYGQEVAAGG